MNHRLTVIGGGQMARALVGGMIAGGQDPSSVRVVDPSVDSRRWWAEHHASVRCGEAIESDDDSDLVLLAVKPGVVRQVTEGSDWAGKLVISIAAGVRLESLCDWIGHRRVVRVMPNTPSLVGGGASGYAVAADVRTEDREIIESMLGSVGMVVEVSESQINAVTGLSGSGPAYVCMVVESLADGGVAAGLPRAVARQLAVQTVLGTARMIAEDPRHTAELKDAVASPGGTTIAAIASLERGGLRSALIEAVLAAKHRADEMDQS